MINPPRFAPEIARWIAQAPARLAASLAVAPNVLLMPVAALASNIVDTADVAVALARVAVVWDTHDAKACAKGHLPSAVNVGDVGTMLRCTNCEHRMRTEQVQAMLGHAGVALLNREVIADGRTGDPFPDAKASQDYHGGLQAWQAEFLGVDVHAIRGGHRPGAVNQPYEANWIDATTPATLAASQVTTRAGRGLKSADELKQLVAGFDHDNEVVGYSHSGMSASVTASVLREPGSKDVKRCEASWLGYAAPLNARVEREVIVHIGAPHGHIAALQDRVAELDAELARVKGMAR